MPTAPWPMARPPRAKAPTAMMPTGDRVAHVGRHQDLPALGRLGHSRRQVDDVSDHIVAGDDHLAHVRTGPQPKGPRCRLEQFDRRLDCGLRRRERQQQAVAQALDDPPAATPDDGADDPVVVGQQGAGRVVTVGRRVAGEPFEIREHDGEWRGDPRPVRGPVLARPRQRLDRVESDSSQRRWPALNGPLEKPLHDVERRRGAERMAPGCLEPVPVDESDLDGIGDEFRVAPQQSGEPLGG